MYSVFDNSTRRLFAQLRKSFINSKIQNFDCLVCPMCSDRLEPLLYDIELDKTDNLEYQKVWWTCRNTGKCFFSFIFPKNVFWTRRTKDEILEGFIPLPNFHLLPEEFHHFYPNLFKKNDSESPEKDFKSIIKQKHSLKKNENKRSKKNEKKKHDLEQQFSPDINESTKRSTNAYQTPAIEFDNEFDSENLIFGNPDSRRCVELFPDANTALSSNLSLQFSTKAFLNTITSEMSKRQLIKPRPAISQKQRITLLSCVEKFNTNNKFDENINSIFKTIEKQKNLPINYKNINSQTSDNLNQNNENDSLDSFDTSTKSQSVNNDLNVFYSINENKIVTKKLKDDIDTSNQFISAMRNFEESKNINSLMLRLGLIDTDYKTSYSYLNNTLVGDDSQQSISLLDKEIIEPNFIANNNTEINSLPTQLNESCFYDENLFSNILIDSVPKDNNVISDSLYTSQVPTSPSSTFFELQCKPSTSTDLQSNNNKIKKKRKRKLPKLNLPFSFDDPELNNLVKTKYSEFMSNVFAERKAKRLKQLNNNELSHEKKNEFSGFVDSLSSNYSDTTTFLKENLNQQKNSQIIDEHGFPIDLNDSLFRSTLDVTEIDKNFYNYSSNPFDEDDLTFGLDQL